MAINLPARMKKIRALRVSSSASRKEYLQLVEQINELQAKANALRESYRQERAKAKSLLQSLQESCQHSYRISKPDKEKPWLMREICSECLKDFSIKPEPELPEPELPEPVKVEPDTNEVEQDLVEDVENPNVPDPRIPELRKQLPEMLLHSWTANIPFTAFVRRVWHQFDHTMDFMEFQHLVLAALNVSKFALRTRQDITVRQFLAIYYKAVNDRMWDSAPNESCLRELRTMLGLYVKRTVGVRVPLRPLSKKSDWTIVK